MGDLPVVTGESTLANSFLGSNMQICVVTRDFRRTMAGLAKAGLPAQP